MPDSIPNIAKQVILAEAAAVSAMADVVATAQFQNAVELIRDCKASVLVSGMGKAGHIARKLAATLSSTGAPSHFLSAGDATHGDLGSIRRGDVILILSFSGESDEILRMLDIVKKLNHPVIAITASKSSSLGRSADIVLALGKIDEACPLGLAPSATTTAMAALGDALALTVMKLKNFTAEDFALYHPGGQLGRKLIRVKEAMTFRRGENLPLTSDTKTVGEALVEVSKITRRSGAVILHNEAGKISGIFTDGDMRRLILANPNAALSKPMREAMTRNPKRINADALASEATGIMRQFRIDELPVVNDADEPVGLIDIHDLDVLRMLDDEPKTPR